MADVPMSAAVGIHMLEVLTDKLRTVQVNYDQMKKAACDAGDSQSNQLAGMMLDVLMEEITK